MAYLTPATLTCPNCGHAGPLTWVTGVPLKREDKGSKGYVAVQHKGDWRVDETETDTIVSCPECKTEVTRRSLTL